MTASPWPCSPWARGLHPGTLVDLRRPLVDRIDDELRVCAAVAAAAEPLAAQYTVDDGGGTGWRVLSVPRRGQPGNVVVAVSLVEVDRTIGGIVARFAIVGGGCCSRSPRLALIDRRVIARGRTDQEPAHSA